MSEQSILADTPRHTTQGELSRNVVDAVAAIQRASQRAVADHLPGRPSQPQLELARVVMANPGSSVHQAATALGLAPNTISTLVGQMATKGWLERRIDAKDRRVARLHLTEQGEDLMRRHRALRADAVGETLAEAARRLGAPAVEQCVEALELVARLLVEGNAPATPSLRLVDAERA